MSRWTLAIYGVTALVAVRSFIALIAASRRRRLAVLLQAEIERRDAEVAAEQEALERLPGLERPAGRTPVAS